MSFPQRELLNMASLAKYLDKPTREAARKWVQRAQVPPQYVGRLLVVDKRDVDRVMDEERRKRQGLCARLRKVG